MKVDFMQRVDYYFGIPLCFCMTILRRVFSLFLPKQRDDTKQAIKPSKILFIELSEMGSAVLAYSSLKKAQSLVGKDNLYFLIFERNRESVELLNLIPKENIIVVNDKALTVFFISTIQAILKIRKAKIDTTLDLELFSRCTALLSFLSGATTRVGFDNYCDEGLYRGGLFTHYVLYNGNQHMALNFLAQVYAISTDRDDLPLIKANMQPYLEAFPEYTVQEDALNRMKDLLENSGYKKSDSNSLLIVNPDPGLLDLRGWPLDKFCEVVKILISEDPNLSVAVIGLGRSRNFYEKIAQYSEVGRVIDLTGKTPSLVDVLALLSFSKCLLTNDSGPAHMASIINLPTVVLFGPESPVRYRPIGEKVIAITANLSCSPCFSAANHRRSICQNNVCMQEITTDSVTKAVKSSLAR